MRRVLRWAVRGVLFVLVGASVALAVFRWQAARRETQSAAAAAPRGGRFVRAADVDVFVQEAGPAEAQALVFVHGTGAWSETWRPTMNATSAAGFRAVAMDLPPFGYSQRPAAPRYGKRDQGRRIVGVLDALGIREAVLVGHSFGGGPTVEAALLAPGRVRALVLVDAALSIRSEAGAAPQPSPLLSGLLAVEPLRDAVVATFLSNPRFTRRLLQSFIADPAAATDERVAVYQRPLSVEGTTRAFGQWLPALLVPSEPFPSESPGSYATLGVPVSVIWGDRDTITPLAQGQRLASLVPGSRLVILAGVGHIPQIEAPEKFNEALLGVLGGPNRSGS